MHSPSSISAISLLQCILLASIAYLLAGAPFLSSITSTLFPAHFDSTASAQRLDTAASAAASASASARKLQNLALPDAGLECARHGVKGVYVLQREPLVVYIEGFVSGDEARELVGLSTPHFTPSTIWTANHETINPTIRKSEKAPLPRTPLVQCIEERARSFQGWRPYTFVEKLWAQRYTKGGHYTYHYDWSAATRAAGRVSSFMVYLEANCTGGGTHFPRLQRPGAGEWCEFLECGGQGGGEGEEKEGIVFKPVAGNAVYWENMREDGTGYLESWHAGLPVGEGVKIGLNIWSWFQDGYVPEVEAAA